MTLIRKAERCRDGPGADPGAGARAASSLLLLLLLQSQGRQAEVGRTTQLPGAFQSCPRGFPGILPGSRCAPSVASGQSPRDVWAGKAACDTVIP